MTRAERRRLRADRSEMLYLTNFHPSPHARIWARRAIEALDRVETHDPRPAWHLRLRLRLQGVDAG